MVGLSFFLTHVMLHCQKGWDGEKEKTMGPEGLKEEQWFRKGRIEMVGKIKREEKNSGEGMKRIDQIAQVTFCYIEIEN